MSEPFDTLRSFTLTEERGDLPERLSHAWAQWQAFQQALTDQRREQWQRSAGLIPPGCTR